MKVPDRVCSWRHRDSPLAGLPDEVTLHTLRHSFASLAADLGYGDAAIAALIGHARSGATARYTHRSDKVLLKVADEVACATFAKMIGTVPAGAAAKL